MSGARLHCEGVLQVGTRHHGWHRCRGSMRKGKNLHMPSRECCKPARIEAAREQTQGAAVQSAAQCAACSTHNLKTTTLTAVAAANSCRSAQRAGAIKLDRCPEKAGQERARQRRPEERCRHLFVQVTCTAEALHSRWAQLLKRLCGQSTLAALAPPCTQKPRCRVEVRSA